MQCKGSYKGDPKGLQRGGRRRGQKISGNFIFQESWADMQRPGWSPWWVQRRPQTIPGPTFEPLTERPTRAPPHPQRESQGLPIIGHVTGNLRASYWQFAGYFEVFDPRRPRPRGRSFLVEHKCGDGWRKTRKRARARKTNFCL